MIKYSSYLGSVTMSLSILLYSTWGIAWGMYICIFFLSILSVAILIMCSTHLYEQVKKWRTEKDYLFTPTVSVMINILGMCTIYVIYEMSYVFLAGVLFSTYAIIFIANLIFLVKGKTK